MKLRFALLGMNIDLSQGRLGLHSTQTRTETETGTAPPPDHLWLLLARQECLEIYERRMLNTDIPVSQERICSKLKKMAPQLRSRR